MREEITLPWTCKTGMKLKVIMPLVVMILGIFGFIEFLYYGNFADSSPVWSFVFMFSVFGILGGIILTGIGIQNFNYSMPKFKCKQQDFTDDSQ